MRRPLLLNLALAALPAIAGCSNLAGGATPPAPAAAPPAVAASPAVPVGAALGGVLGGPLGASLTEADRQAAYEAQLAALDSGERRTWRGVHGVFGYVEPGAPSGGAGCRAYTQTIFIAGRPQHGQGVGCKQADGAWTMAN